MLAFGSAQPRLWERVRISCFPYGRDEERVGDMAVWLGAKRHLVKAVDLSQVVGFAYTGCLLGALAGGTCEELAIVTPLESVHLGMLCLPRLRKLSIASLEYDFEAHSGRQETLELNGSFSRLAGLQSLRVRSRKRVHCGVAGLSVSNPCAGAGAVRFVGEG